MFEGAVLLCGSVPLQTWVGKQFGRLRVKTAGKTDRRIRLMNEIVNGMKVIKMYTWEKPFATLVHEAREEEIDVVRNTSYYRAFNFSFFFSASRFILFCTFMVFGFTGQVVFPPHSPGCLSRTYRHHHYKELKPPTRSSLQRRPSSASLCSTLCGCP